MKKIVSLFQRNYDGDRLVRDEVVPGAEWVLAGEGIATVKWDGTSCLVRDGVLYKRYDAKKGKTPPPNFEPAQEPDPITGHWPGWLPVGDGPEDKWHREAFAKGVDDIGQPLEDATYELVGPKVQGNPYKLTGHLLIRHVYNPKALDAMGYAPRTFEALRAFFELQVIEGIVWHHPDGRMVKIKRRDFGFPWPVKEAV
jgi:hypothetical protein